MEKEDLNNQDSIEEYEKKDLLDYISNIKK